MANTFQVLWYQRLQIFFWVKFCFYWWTPWPQCWQRRAAKEMTCFYRVYWWLAWKFRYTLEMMDKLHPPHSEVNGSIIQFYSLSFLKKIYEKYEWGLVLIMIKGFLAYCYWSFITKFINQSMTNLSLQIDQIKKVNFIKWRSKNLSTILNKKTPHINCLNLLFLFYFNLKRSDS